VSTRSIVPRITHFVVCVRACVLFLCDGSGVAVAWSFCLLASLAPDVTRLRSLVSVGGRRRPRLLVVSCRVLVCSLCLASLFVALGFCGCGQASFLSWSFVLLFLACTVLDLWLTRTPPHRRSSRTLFFAHTFGSLAHTFDHSLFDLHGDGAS
jgi:hypothetical protein